jgi:hypothetical protein
VREREDHDARPGPRALVGLLQVGEHVLVRAHGDLRHGRAGEDGREQVDRVAGRRHEREVARLDQHPQQVREALLRADRRDRLGLGIELDAEPARVHLADGSAQVRDAAARGVAVVPRPPRRLGELVDGDLRRRDVRVAEAQVDDVLAGAAQLQLQPLDLGERVGREVGDTGEPFHRRQSFP